MTEPASMHELRSKRILSGLLGAKGHTPLPYFSPPVLLVLVFLLAILLHEKGASFGIRTSDIFTNMVSEASPLALLAIGAGLVLASGGVDLSSAAVATIAGITFASLLQAGIPKEFAAIVAMLLGLVSGFSLGWIVCHDISPLIASWATGSLWIVVSLVYSTLMKSSGLLNSEVSGVPTGVVVPTSVSYNLITVGVVLVALQISNLQRYSRAVGANRDSAVYAGIRTTRVLKQCYSVAGALAALAGVLWAILNNKGSTTSLIGQELTGIAVAVIGGTAMSGGYLRPFSIVCASALWILIQLLTKGVVFEGETKYQQHLANAFFALVILGLAFFTSRRNIDLTLIQRLKEVDESSRK